MRFFCELVFVEVVIIGDELGEFFQVLLGQFETLFSVPRVLV